MVSHRFAIAFTLAHQVLPPYRPTGHAKLLAFGFWLLAVGFWLLAVGFGSWLLGGWEFWESVVRQWEVLGVASLRKGTGNGWEGDFHKDAKTFFIAGEPLSREQTWGH